MPTPIEWIENLERIRKIANAEVEEQPQPEPEKGEIPEEMKAAVGNIGDACRKVARSVLDQLPNVPEDKHEDFLTGVLLVMTMQVIEMAANEFED